MQNYHRNTFELFTLRRIVCTYIQIKYQQWIQMKHNSVPKIKTKPADMTKWPLNEIKWIPRQSDEDTLQACSVAWERGDLKHNGRFAPWRRKKKLTAAVVLIRASSCTPRQRDACDWRRRLTAMQAIALEMSASSDDAQRGNRAGYSLARSL